MEDDSLGVADGTADVVVQNGVRLNGVRLNGTALSGAKLNGVKYGGAKLGTVSINGVSLDNSQLKGNNASTGKSVSGAGFVGVQFDGTLSTGATLKLRIDSAATLAAPNTDTWSYGVSYLSGSTWYPLCDASTTSAIATKGTFNQGEGVSGGGSFSSESSMFTFGCRGAAIAKCIEMGYKPWKSVSGTNLTNHHVACTRMIRADYCGDGRAFTVDGTPINVYDNLGIQADTETWATDAEWKTSGARCVNSTRAATLGTLPSCMSSISSGSCGGSATKWSSGTLVVDEYN